MKEFLMAIAFVSLYIFLSWAYAAYRDRKPTPLEEVSVFKDMDKGICFYVTEQILDGQKKIISIDSVECREVK